MRKYIFILLLIIVQSSFGQIKFGAYDQKKDTLKIGKGLLISSAQISVNKDSTFTYNNRSSAGCLVWYDIKGTWAINNNELYLMDTAIVINKNNQTESMLRTSLFRIENDNLKFIYSYFDNRRRDCEALRNIMGDFIYKN